MVEGTVDVTVDTVHRVMLSGTIPSVFTDNDEQNYFPSIHTWVFVFFCSRHREHIYFRGKEMNEVMCITSQLNLIDSSFIT